MLLVLYNSVKAKEIETERGSEIHKKLPGNRDGAYKAILTPFVTFIK